MTTVNPSDLNSTPPLYGDDLIPSVEKGEDEGYESHANNSISATWNFHGLNSGASPRTVSRRTSNAGDADSDVAEMNSSASESSLSRRKAEFADAEPDEQFEETYIPDMTTEQEAAEYALRSEVQQVRLKSRLNDSNSDDIDAPVFEIHVGDNDELKLD